MLTKKRSKITEAATEIAGAAASLNHANVLPKSVRAPRKPKYNKPAPHYATPGASASLRRAMLGTVSDPTLGAALPAVNVPRLMVIAGISLGLLPPIILPPNPGPEVRIDANGAA